MVQLKVYDGSTQYWLDLYEEQPIKLTLSIEDITETTARSVFSRTFRVPATANNNKFFKHAFVVEGIDYDVTIKKRAEILVDGAEFKVGHIRLQKIYVNKAKDSVDYEIVFLGETRDFASVLGEKTLNQLDLTAYTFILDETNIRTSWEAYPSDKKSDGTPITPSATNGLKNGDVLFPLIDFGNAVNEPRIAYTQNDSGGGFNHANKAIGVTRFKPMMRAKTLLREIFTQAGFDFTSNFIDSDDFLNIYVSAFGNEPGTNENPSNENLLDVALLNPFSYGSSQTVRVPFSDVILDPGQNWFQSSFEYRAPVASSVSLPYRFNVELSGEHGGDEPGQSVVTTVKLVSSIQGVLFTDVNTTTPSGQSFPFGNWSSQFTVDVTNAQPNERFYVTIEGDRINQAEILIGSFSVPLAPGNFSLASEFDSDYKQIDFVRDMLTTFRMVMAPSKTNPRSFIIEPWVNYIATGDTYDWTHKVDGNKDFQIEPLFFTQSDRIEFSNAPDTDYLNDRNETIFKEIFGTLKFESNNELLKGKREIKTNLAATPMTQIEGAPDTNFIIPKIHAHDETLTELEGHEPIKPKTRLLYYNGLIEQQPTASFPQNNKEWYFGSGNGEIYFPMVSYWQNVPMTATGLNLNWQIERGYANDYAGYNYTLGTSLYTRFWSSYIGSLYNKYARRVTCSIILDSVDLQNFSFDDIVFIDGVYYRPEKVVDAVIGEKSPVKVQLIKLLSTATSVTSGGPGGDNPVDPDPGSGYTTDDVVWQMSPCDGGATIIVGPANMQVQAGQSAVINGECYSFDAPIFWSEENQPTFELTDPTTYADCQACECATASTLTVTVTNTTDATCNQNDGSLTFISSGGVAPFTYVITDGVGNTVLTVTRNSHITNTLTAIGSDTYTVTATDACGNTASDTGIVFDDCGSNGPSGG